MILPTKHLSADRALLTLGGRVLKLLDRPRTVSSLWERMLRQNRGTSGDATRLSYDWFVLTLDLLYAFGTVDLKEGLLVRQKVAPNITEASGETVAPLQLQDATATELAPDDPESLIVDEFFLFAPDEDEGSPQPPE